MVTSNVEFLVQAQLKALGAELTYIGDVHVIAGVHELPKATVRETKLLKEDKFKKKKEKKEGYKGEGEGDPSVPGGQVGRPRSREGHLLQTCAFH